MTIESARKLALSFDEAVELPHFQLTSFRIRNKIFATMDTRLGRLCVMLSPVDQSVFCAYDPSVIYPVPNKWGKKGATYVELSKAPKDVVKDAIAVSYCAKAPRGLAAKYSR